MARPPSDRVDEAYLTWATEGARSDARTAELLGIPRRTINEWRRVHGWDRQWLAAAGPEAGKAAGRAGVEVRLGLTAVAREMLEIVTARTEERDAQGELTGRMVPVHQARDRIQAAKLLKEWGVGREPDVNLIEAHIVAPSVL